MKKPSSWRIASITIFVLITLISLLNVKKGPGGVDCWYHMAVARNILSKRRIPLYADWEYYPVGRPHLYPPFLHSCVALLSIPFRGNVLAGGKVFNALMLPISTALAILGFSRIYKDPWREFLALIILCMDPIFFGVHRGLLPSVLASAFAFLALAYFYERNLYPCVLMMTLCLYTHLGIPYLFLLGLFIFSTINREYLSFYGRFFLASMVLFSPWGLHVLSNFDWIEFGFRLVRGDRPIVISIITVLGFLGALIAIGKRELPGLLALSCLLGFSPAFILYGRRFWAHSSLLWAMLASTPLYSISKGRKIRKLVIALLILILSLLFQPGILLSKMGVRKGWFPGGLREEIELLSGGDYSMLGEDVKTIVRIINSEFKELEAVHVNRGWVGEMLYVFTGKKTDLAMYGEVMDPILYKPVLEKIKYERPALFVFLREGGRYDLPNNLDEVHVIGRFYLGVRW
ncbi:MAG: hypothetical protein DRO05_00085 [Thermoproteota archaeon]|nr:MAG: hypothetical protein DRO05_00085 [Candidatus Korarchaeota archaeon]